MNWNELCNYYSTFEVKGGISYWTQLIIEYILDNFTIEQINNMKLTKEKIDKIALEVIDDDALWKEIDYAIVDIVGKNIKGE